MNCPCEGESQSSISSIKIANCNRLDKPTFIEDLWILRFFVFEKEVLKHALDDPLNAADVISFLDCVTKTMKPVGDNKPDVAEEYIRKGFDIVIRYGIVKYNTKAAPDADMRISLADAQLVQSWLDKAIQSNRITRGVWEKRVWLSFMLVSRMTRAWLKRHLVHGARNWDWVFYRHMALVLVSALGRRAGDVAQAQRYVASQYLKYEDIRPSSRHNVRRRGPSSGTRIKAKAGPCHGACGFALHEWR
jgi:hypothetical protein